MSDWSSRNGFKPYKPRNDLIVLERGGDLVVRKRRWRKHRQGVERLPYAVLPPPKPQCHHDHLQARLPLLEVIPFPLLLKGK